MPQVAIQKISWSSREQFVRDVFAAATAVGLRPAAAELVVAHAALSSGWGRAADNFRLWGIKSVSESDDYTIVSGTEIINGVETPKTPMKWRAFSSLQESVAAFLKLIQVARYSSAYAMLQAGDPEYFAEVGRNGWYTADPAVVKANCLTRLSYIQKVLGSPDSAGMLTGAGGIAALWPLALGALVAWLYAKWRK